MSGSERKVDSVETSAQGFISLTTLRSGGLDKNIWLDN